MSASSLYSSISATVHESASMGRRLGHWGNQTVSHNSVVQQDLRVLRNRSSASIRDNPWLKRVLTVSTSNEIGTGIIPRPNTPDKELNKQLQELWLDQLPYLDYNGILGGYGIQGVSASARKEAGEVFILIHRGRKRASIPVPIQFQILESEFCPVDLNHELLSNGNSIITGIEVNTHGKKVAVWFHKRDPRETRSLHLDDLHRVPVENVIHHFKMTKPGQLRAVPEITTGLVKARTFEQYNDAELMRKASRAELTGTIEREVYNSDDYKYDPFTGKEMQKDHADVGILDFEPGTFIPLHPGEKINLLNTDDAGRGYADFQMWQLLGISAGTDVPYQLLSGDFREINDRLWRAIFNQYKREIQYMQTQFIIPQVCRVMWNEFVNRAIVTGAVTTQLSGWQVYRVKHRPQAWEYIQPVQDGQAKINALRAGLTSRTEVIDQMSGDSTAEHVDEERAEDKNRAEELGVPVADGQAVHPIEDSPNGDEHIKKRGGKKWQ